MLKTKTEFLIGGLLGIIICLPALWPFFQPQFFHLHDWTHVARLVEMDQALKDGHFPVRWSADLGYGFGMPQFNFYAPLPYYIAELFHLLGMSFIWSIKLLVIFNFWISFIALYWLGNRLWGKWAGLIAGTAFIYAPYRAVDTYVRGAFGELTAITFIALSLYCLVRWVKQPTRRWFAYTALALGGLILSHNLVAFLALPLLWALAVSGALVYRRQWRLAGTALLIFLLGVGVSAFYSLPALAEKQYTQVDTLTTGFSDYHQHFLYLRQFLQNRWGYGGSIFGPNDNISFYLGLGQMILGLAGVMTVFVCRKKPKRLSNWLIVMSAGIIGFSILMSTFKMQWLWNGIPLFKYVQFPWRYLSVIIVFLSILSGAAFRLFPQKRKIAASAMTVAACGGLIFLNLANFKPEAYLTDNNALYYTDAGRIQREMSGIIPDFLPIQANPKLNAPPDIRFEIIPPARSLTIDIDRTQEFHLTAKLDQPSTLIVNSFYFPGWTLYINGQKAPIIIDPLKGTMSLNLSQTGEAAIAGQLAETPIRVLANLISLVSLIVVGYLLLPDKKYGRY